MTIASTRQINQTSIWPGLVERLAKTRTNVVDDLAIVLIHGAMDRAAGMVHLARSLRDFTTIRFDRRGYGHAQVLGPGTLVQHVDDLNAIVSDRPVILFGHSFGGLVALGAAASHQIDVRVVVTWEVPTPWIPDWLGWKLAGDGTDPTQAAESFMVATIGDDRWRSLPERTRVARRADGPALVADVDPTLKIGPPFASSRVVVPCLFGAGDSGMVPYAAGAQWLASHIPDAQWRVVSGFGHDAPTVHASAIAQLIRDTLERIIAPAL